MLRVVIRFCAFREAEFAVQDAKVCSPKKANHLKSWNQM